jgi:hypothetical protein
MCENHVQTKPFVLQLYPGHTGAKALVVEDALSCGACSPRSTLVSLPELDDV